MVARSRDLSYLPGIQFKMCMTWEFGPGPIVRGRPANADL